ncbi:MAG: hypothetical protein KBH07_13725 [Flavobacteriales bacterium]|nr:hypothetical protein [Flavobacteriales bacterium]
MRTIGTKLSGALLLAVLLAAGCLKTEEFPKEPHIGFKSYVQGTDSARLTISFTDGDGDIGLAPGDTLAPFNPGSHWYHNFFVDYYKLQNGQWELQVFTLPLYYRIPVITPTGQNKTLEGDIAVELSPLVLPQVPGDTVRFGVHIADRALNESNTVFTEAIIVQ